MPKKKVSYNEFGNPPEQQNELERFINEDIITCVPILTRDALGNLDIEKWEFCEKELESSIDNKILHIIKEKLKRINFLMLSRTRFYSWHKGRFLYSERQEIDQETAGVYYRDIGVIAVVGVYVFYKLGVKSGFADRVIHTFFHELAHDIWDLHLSSQTRQWFYNEMIKRAKLYNAQTIQEKIQNPHFPSYDSTRDLTEFFAESFGFLYSSDCFPDTHPILFQKIRDIVRGKVY